MADRFDEMLAEMRSDRAEMRCEFASWRAHIDRLQEQTDENLRFLRELNRRGELALQELVRGQGAMREDIRPRRARSTCRHGGSPPGPSRSRP